MRQFSVVVATAVFIVVGTTSPFGSDGSTGQIKVILRGELDSELAPHGQGNVYAPDVIWHGKVFRMWYGGQGKDGHDRISFAESADGRSWLRKGVVLKDDLANHVNDPCVVWVNGRYMMYYTRTEKDVVDRIDLAVSSDGQKWEPKGAVITAGSEGTWDSLSVGRPSVIFHDGKYKMWYDGRKDFPPGTPVKGVPISSTSSRSVGYATSEDGFRWIRHPNNPVFGHDAGAVDVKRLGDQFIMLYESRDGTRCAVSKDCLTWNDRGVFVAKSGSSIDQFGHVTPFLFVDPDNKQHRLFVGAAEATTWDHNSIAVLKIDEDQLRLIIGKSGAP
ncbi:MAG: hypothetical protein WCH39_13055 [Schlesneria sp.]